MGTCHTRVHPRLWGRILRGKLIRKTEESRFSLSSIWHGWNLSPSFPLILKSDIKGWKFSSVMNILFRNAVLRKTSNMFLRPSPGPSDLAVQDINHSLQDRCQACSLASKLSNQQGVEIFLAANTNLSSSQQTNFFRYSKDLTYPG